MIGRILKTAMKYKSRLALAVRPLSTKGLISY